VPLWVWKIEGTGVGREDATTAVVTTGGGKAFACVCVCVCVVCGVGIELRLWMMGMGERRAEGERRWDLLAWPRDRPAILGNKTLLTSSD
jgi:hypothetical protein